MPSRSIYLFPTELEARPFRELCPDAEVIISGVGMAATSAAIASLAAEGRLTSGARLLLCGLAGSYSAAATLGEVVEVVSECCVELPERFREEYRNEPLTTLRAVRSNTVHGAGAVAATAEIENMEGAALFTMAARLGVRCAEIRAVSNRVGEPFEKWRVQEALEALARTLMSIEI